MTSCIVLVLLVPVVLGKIVTSCVNVKISKGFLLLHELQLKLKSKVTTNSLRVVEARN